MIAALVTVIAATTATLVATPATANPLDVGHVDSYQPNSDAPCSDTAQPGTVGLAGILEKSYDYEANIDIRACDPAEYMSDHSRGLAIDWQVRAGNDAGEEFLRWLFEADGSGNAHVRLRRLGISYIIWNDRIWDADRNENVTSPNISNWPSYDESACLDKYATASDVLPISPASTDCLHARHMHISLSDAGGQKSTTWWSVLMNGHRDAPGAATVDRDVIDHNIRGALDNDDLVLLSEGGALYVAAGKGDGSFYERVLVESGLDNVRDVALGDVTGDLVPDIVLLYANGSVRRMTGKPNGEFYGVRATPIATGWTAVKHITVGDVEGGGSTPEIIAVDDANRLKRAVRGPDGNFYPLKKLSEGSNADGMVDVVAADITGTRRAEIIGVSNGGILYVWTAESGWVRDSTYLDTRWSGVTELAAGDWDGDEQTDLVGIKGSQLIKAFGLATSRGFGAPSASSGGVANWGLIVRLG